MAQCIHCGYCQSLASEYASPIPASLPLSIIAGNVNSSASDGNGGGGTESGDRWHPDREKYSLLSWSVEFEFKGYENWFQYSGIKVIRILKCEDWKPKSYNIQLWLNNYQLLTVSALITYKSRRSLTLYHTSENGKRDRYWEGYAFCIWIVVAEHKHWHRLHFLVDFSMAITFLIVVHSFVRGL